MNLRLCRKLEPTPSGPDLSRLCSEGLPITTFQETDLTGLNPLSALTLRPYDTATFNHRCNSPASANRRASPCADNTSPHHTLFCWIPRLVLPPLVFVAPTSNRNSDRRFRMPDSSPACAITAAKPRRAATQLQNPNPAPPPLMGLAQFPFVSVSTLSSPTRPRFKTFDQSRYKQMLSNPIIYLTMNGCTVPILPFDGSRQQLPKLSGIKSLSFQVYQTLDLCVINENIWDFSPLAFNTSLCSYSPMILLLDVYKTISRFTLDDSRKPTFCHRPDLFHLPNPTPFLPNLPWSKPDTLLLWSDFMDCKLLLCRPLSCRVLQNRLSANPMEQLPPLSFSWHGDRCVSDARLFFVVEEGDWMFSLSEFIKGSTLLSAANYMIDNSVIEAISIPSFSSLFVFINSHHVILLFRLQADEIRGLLHIVCCLFCKMAVSILCFNVFRLLSITAVSAALWASSFVINFSFHGG